MTFGRNPFSFWFEDVELVQQMDRFSERLPEMWRERAADIHRSAQQKRRGAGADDRQDITVGNQYLGGDGIAGDLKITFAGDAQAARLKGLLPVIEGLMGMRPQIRISTEDALEMAKTVVIEPDVDRLGDISDDTPYTDKSQAVQAG